MIIPRRKKVPIKSDFLAIRHFTIGKYLGDSCFFLTGRINRLLSIFKMVASTLFIGSLKGEPVIKIVLPKNRYGPQYGQVWAMKLPPCRSVKLTYEVFFEKEFDFVKGGKLPGLGGGNCNSGGAIPSGHDGWSCRLMFLESGLLGAYLYYPLMKTNFGEFTFFSVQDQPFFVKTGQWHLVSIFVLLNDEGNNNGVLNISVDNEVFFERGAMVFRFGNSLFVDHMLFSCFLGGDDCSWAPQKDQSIYFKNIKIDSCEDTRSC